MFDELCDKVEMSETKSLNFLSRSKNMIFSDLSNSLKLYCLVRFLLFFNRNPSAKNQLTGQF